MSEKVAVENNAGSLAFAAIVVQLSQPNQWKHYAEAAHLRVRQNRAIGISKRNVGKYEH